MPTLKIKRIYEKASDDDGLRILVDRLWPRGVRKEEASIDLWLKEIAPSAELRSWFGHDPGRWDEFKKRYFMELGKKPEIVNLLLEKTKEKRLTLLFSARDPEFNNAAALREYLENRLYKRSG